MKNKEKENIKISREQRAFNNGTPCPLPAPRHLSKKEIKVLDIEREKLVKSQ